jgi:hypothetical protein
MPTRLQRRRTRGWRLPANAVIIDRTSRYGNPFTVAALLDLGYAEAAVHDEAVIRFRLWLGGDRNLWLSDIGDHRRERILSSLHLLRGRDLACPCPEGATCHGDEYLLRANLPPDELAAWTDQVRQRVDGHRAWRGEDPMYTTEATR